MVYECITKTVPNKNIVIVTFMFGWIADIKAVCCIFQVCTGYFSNKGGVKPLGNEADVFFFIVHLFAHIKINHYICSRTRKGTCPTV